MNLKYIGLIVFSFCLPISSFGSVPEECIDALSETLSVKDQPRLVSEESLPSGAISIQFDARFGKKIWSVGDAFQLSGYKALDGHPDYYLTQWDRKGDSLTDAELKELKQLLEFYAYELADLAQTTNLTAAELAKIYIEGRLFIQLTKSQMDESAGRVWSVNMFERLPDNRLLYLNPLQPAKMNEYSIQMYTQLYVPSKKSVDMAAFRRGQPVINPTHIYAIDKQKTNTTTVERLYGKIPIDYSNTRAYVGGQPGYVNLGRFPYIDIEGTYAVVDRTGSPTGDAIQLYEAVAIRRLKPFNLNSLMARP